MNLDRELRTIVDDFTRAGFPVPAGAIEPKVRLMDSTWRLGQCEKRPGGAPSRYRISVSKNALLSESSVRNTLAHEVIHTMYGCYNHGKRFKYYAAKARALGYHVTTRASEAEMAASGMADKRLERARYRITCGGCGNVLYRQKASAVIRNPGRYRCAKCGSALIVEELRNNG